MEPIDNADKKTFFEWIGAKGAGYVFVEIFISVFYVFCSILAISQYAAGKMLLDKGEFIFLMIALNVTFWVNFFKTYQNYCDDKIGRTR